MGACDIDVSSDFTIRRTSPLQAIAGMLGEMVADEVQDEQQQIAKLRKAIEDLRNFPKKEIRPGHIYLDYPKRVLWNWLVDQILGLLDGLVKDLNELEQTILDATDRVQTVLEGVGNPATLHDIATMLREGVAARTAALAQEVTLVNLAVDNGWESEAADKYAERAQLQINDGLDELTEAAEALATFLETHAETEVGFWESLSDFIVNLMIFLAGLGFTLIGAVATVAGLAAAGPTAGISLLVTVLGIIGMVGGLLVSLISGWLLVKSFQDLLDNTDATLAAGIDDMNAKAITAGATWPVLAS